MKDRTVIENIKNKTQYILMQRKGTKLKEIKIQHKLKRKTNKKIIQKTKKNQTHEKVKEFYNFLNKNQK